MVNFNEACSSFAAAVLEYDTNKIVHIKSKKVGLINRIIQLAIIGYVIGYVIIYEKGYQSFDVGLSSVTTKLKGTALTNLSINFPVNISNGIESSKLFDGPRIWDSSDYVIPPEENDAVFVMTNMIITPRQKQGMCPEDDQYTMARCYSDANCTKGEEVITGHGVMTGRCIAPDRQRSDRGNYNVCEIYSWCPVEYDKLPMPGTNSGNPLRNDTCLLDSAINFTILIKNTVQFPEFGVRVRNINDKQNKTYLTRCHYSSSKENRLCPIISLKTIFDEISDTAFEDACIKGGIVAIKIKWDCDLDYDESECLPHYSFGRVDNAHAQIAGGYNFRFATYDVENDTQYRTLIKAYGIRFVIMVDAKAGKFDIIPLLRNLGAGLALLSVATVMCDICVLYLLKKKYFYRNKKYQYVDDPDASSTSEDEASLRTKPEERTDSGDYENIND
ncbi:P2X purinoceptor 4-like isoform X1 [Dendronephthya gigantea]|uniref:P2X purinoceptor 4-like isoform X1 n=1 Tax=Dendronephthya gigantea TaxID=151771 RepID=UPI00106CC435|nr:P2X purinoceptor 4-like isoform X1 [Dendronephthya gigantea]